MTLRLPLRPWRLLPWLLSGLVAALGATPVPAAPAATGLGVWFTTVDSAVLFDPQQSRQALTFLNQHGFTRVALPLYTAGLLSWQPESGRNPLAVPSDPRLQPIGPLLEALGGGGLERVGWFEFGLMAPAGAPWLEGRDELLLRDGEGGSRWLEAPGLERVWLNPLQPAVQQQLEDLVVDACRRLPLELIQFDDHLGYPVRFGYDPLTLATWRATAAGQANPTPAPQDPAWIAWRAAQVTALLERLRAAMARACPALRLSVSPNPLEFSTTRYLADWGEWVRRGLVDEVVVQIYRRDLASLERELAHPSLAEAQRRVPVRIGLLAGLKNQPMEAAHQLPLPSQQRRQGYDAVDLFFYESARLHFPEAAGP